MNNKYMLTEESIVLNNITLYRIKALNSFSYVKEGELGGYIQREDNLSQLGYAWVCENAKVYGNAKVSGNAKVYGDTWVSGNAKVYGDAWVSGNAKVYGDAWVYGNAEVCGNADYIVFKNWWSSGRYFTWTRSNNAWKVGCFFGTSEELVAKAYKDSEESGREYEKIVNYVKSILNN